MNSATEVITNVQMLRLLVLIVCSLKSE